MQLQARQLKQQSDIIHKLATAAAAAAQQTTLQTAAEMVADDHRTMMVWSTTARDRGPRAEETATSCHCSDTSRTTPRTTTPTRSRISRTNIWSALWMSSCRELYAVDCLSISVRSWS